MDLSKKHNIGQKMLNKNKYILCMIPFIKSIKTKPVRGQDSSRGFGRSVDGGRCFWVLVTWLSSICTNSLSCMPIN